MDTSNIVTLIFVVAAVFVFLQLRNVLGRRTGHERPPFDPYARSGKDVGNDDAGEADNVITLPGRGEKSDPYSDIDKVAKPGTELNAGLRAIRDAAPDFDPQEFLAGAKMAYEMIVMAFADGDRKTLRNLLTKDVYEGFEAALDEREARGETVQTNFVGIDSISISAAQMREHEALVTVSVVSQLVSATRGADGEIVEGDPDAVAEVQDVWTFVRDVRDRDPNWKLEATEADD
ncbi:MULTISPECIES: Tim44/TimA family putative adaptor protein [unclassified Roseitalea]|uniref:Tim44/TimA family putative adaptor protein n=1 Tax=unclassified Roseitalea TaxID=2639107 RepID=UPI00273EBEB6|nr:MULTISPECIES: Tim44/TimA family putative adaptor protein [unclassified Roseitalea]